MVAKDNVKTIYVTDTQTASIYLHNELIIVMKYFSNV